MSTETADVVADDFDVDVTNVNPDSFEQQMANGKLVPEGFYMAFLNGATRGRTEGDPDATPPKPSRAYWKLTFKIVGGVYDGQEVEDSLYAPLGNKAMENRVLLFKHRLGLVKRTADGKAFEPVAGVVDFQDVTDAQVIISVKHEKYVKKDGGEGASARLDFNGLYSVDDAKAKEKIGKPVEPKADAGGAANGTTKAKSEPVKKQFNPQTDL